MQSAVHGNSTKAEVRAIQTTVVKTVNRVVLGDALSALSQTNRAIKTIGKAAEIALIQICLAKSTLDMHDSLSNLKVIRKNH